MRGEWSAEESRHGQNDVTIPDPDFWLAAYQDTSWDLIIKLHARSSLYRSSIPRKGNTIPPGHKTYNSPLDRYQLESCALPTCLITTRMVGVLLLELQRVQNV